MQIQPTSTGGITPVVNSTETAATERLSGVVAETQKARHQSLRNGQGQQFKVLSKWSQLADVSKALAENENAERTLKRVYAGLEKLRQQTEHPAVVQDLNPSKTRTDLHELKRMATHPASGLDNQLEPKYSGNPIVVRQLPEKMDFLSARPMTEKIQLMMGRSGQYAQIELSANAGPDENLQALKQAFAPLNIQVQLGNQQRLQFIADTAHAWPLKEPWVMVGEGVRVAAGNPVSVTLSEPEHPLDGLSNILNKTPVKEVFQEHIRQVQGHIREVLRTLVSQSQALRSELQQIQMAGVESAQDMRALSESVAGSMNASGAKAVAVVMSQANVTRNLVSFSLHKPV